MRSIGAWLMPRSVERQALRMNKGTLLVIDDEKDLLELVRYNLEKDGFDVICAADGQSGLEIATRRCEGNAADRDSGPLEHDLSMDLPQLRPTPVHAQKYKQHHSSAGDFG